MKRFIFVTIFSLFLSSLIGMSFNYDYARFMFSPDTSLVEIYIETPFNQIEYHNEEKGLTGYIHYYIDIEPFNGNPLHYDWISIARIPSMEYARKKDLTIVDQANFYLPADSYSVKVTVADSFSNKKQTQEFMIIADKWTTKKPVISDIELAIRMEKADNPTKFNKGDLFILPNAKKEFGTTRFLLAEYAEIYNLEIGKPYYITYEITNTELKTIKKLPSIEDTAHNIDITDFNKFNILGLPEGKYLLKMTISQDTLSYTTYKEFYKKNVKINLEKIDRYPLSRRKYWDKIDYIATEKEKSVWSKLKSEQGKEAFLRHFWDIRDKTPNDTLNETLLAFQKNIEYVNNNFSEMNKEGYYTDRGRIYLTYGKPDEVIKLESEDLFPAQELWIYYDNGGEKYYFANIEGKGWILILSTNEDEQGIAHWERYLNPAIDETMKQ